MIAVSDSEDFGRLIQALSRDIIDAAVYFKLFRDIVSGLKEHPDVEIQSRAYWSLSADALLNTALAALCRAYDQEEKGLHLTSWLRTIEDNMYLFDESEFRERMKDNPYVESLSKDARRPDQVKLKADMESCSASNPDVRTLLIHRGNLMAHRNAKNVVNRNDVTSKYPLQFTVIESLIEI